MTLGGGMTMQNGSAIGSAASAEGARVLPLGVNPAFDLAGIESLVEHENANNLLPHANSGLGEARKSERQGLSRDLPVPDRPIR